MPEFSTKKRQKDLSSKPAWATQDSVSEGKGGGGGLEGSSALAALLATAWQLTAVYNPSSQTPSCRQSSNAH